MSSGNKTALGYLLLTVGLFGPILIIAFFAQRDVVVATTYSFTGHAYWGGDTYYKYYNISAQIFWPCAAILYLWLALTLCYILVAKPQGLTGKLSSRKIVLIYGAIGTIVLLIVSGGYPRIDYLSLNNVSSKSLGDAFVTRFEWSIIAIPLLWFALLLWHFSPRWKPQLAEMFAPKPAPKIQPRRRVEKPVSKKGGIRILGGDDEE